MRGAIPILLVLALSGCAAHDQVVRTPSDRVLARNVCPQPGGPEQTQSALMGPSRFVDLISSNETMAYGPTRIVWVHPPDEVLNRCR